MTWSPVGMIPPRSELIVTGWKFSERVYEIKYADTTPPAGSAPQAAGAPANPVGLALVWGRTALARASGHARGIALGTVVFAIAGFLVGLTFTLRGSEAIDIAYRATVLLLLVTHILLTRSSPEASG
jgi:hypothetical protein